jgi:hypothetical protein
MLGAVEEEAMLASLSKEDRQRVLKRLKKLQEREERKEKVRATMKGEESNHMGLLRSKFLIHFVYCDDKTLRTNTNQIQNRYNTLRLYAAPTSPEAVSSYFLSSISSIPL